MKILLFILLILFSAGTDRTTSHVITEKKGFDQFEIDKTTLPEVIAVLGTKYHTKKHKNYSIETQYAHLGVSFYYKPNDKAQQIFGIKFRPPFEGKTTKGVELNLSTMQDMLQTYGEPPHWFSCKKCDTWAAEYDGIEFFFERDKSIPHFPFQEQPHLNKKIIEILVMDHTK